MSRPGRCGSGRIRPTCLGNIFARFPQKPPLAPFERWYLRREIPVVKRNAPRVPPGFENIFENGPPNQQGQPPFPQNVQSTNTSPATSNPNAGASNDENRIRGDSSDLRSGGTQPLAIPEGYDELASRKDPIIEFSLQTHPDYFFVDSFRPNQFNRTVTVICRVLHPLIGKLGQPFELCEVEVPPCADFNRLRADVFHDRIVFSAPFVCIIYGAPYCIGDRTRRRTLAPPVRPQDEWCQFEGVAPLTF